MKSGPAGGAKPKRRDIDEERRRLRDEFGVLDGGDDSSRIVLRYLTLAETADLVGPMPSSAGLLRLIAPNAGLRRLRLLLTLPPEQETPKPSRPSGFWKRVFGRHAEDLPDPTDALEHWLVTLPAPALTRLIHSLEARRLEIHVRAQAPNEGPAGLMVFAAPESRDGNRAFRGAIVGATPPDAVRRAASAELLVFVDREEQVERLQHQFDDWWDDALPRRQELLRFAREHLERLTSLPVPGLPGLRLSLPTPTTASFGEKQEIRVAWSHVASVKLERALGESGPWKTLIQQPGSPERKGTFRGRFPIQDAGAHHLRATGIDATGRPWISPAIVLTVEAPPVPVAAPEAPPAPSQVEAASTVDLAEGKKTSSPEAVMPPSKKPEREQPSNPTSPVNGSSSAAKSTPEETEPTDQGAPEQKAPAASTEPEGAKPNGSSESEAKKAKETAPATAKHASPATEVPDDSSPKASPQPAASDPKNPSPRLFYELVLHEIFSRPISTGLAVPTNRIKNLSGGDDALKLLEDLAAPSAGNVRLQDVLRVQFLELKRDAAFVDRMAASLRSVPLVVELRAGDAPFDLLLVRRDGEPLLLPWDRQTNQILDSEDLATLTILEQARANTKPSKLDKLPYSLGVVIRMIRERYDTERARPRQLPRAMAKALTRLDMIALSTEDSSLQIHSDALRTQLATVPPPVVGVERLESLVRDGAKVPNREFVQLVEDFLTDLEKRLRATAKPNDNRPQKVRVDLLAALVRPSAEGK